MRAATRLFGLVAAGALIAGSAQAQSCRGYSSLDAKHMNVAAKAFFSDGTSQFGAQLNMRHVGFGQNHFIGIGASTASFDGGGSAFNLNGDLGIEFKTSSAIEWCPMVNVSYTNYEGDASGLDLGAGIGLGKALGSSGGGMEFVPFGNVSFVHSKFTVVGVSGSDNAFQFGAGVGLRFKNGMQISPQFMKSTADGSEVVFGATVSFPFGHGM